MKYCVSQSQKGAVLPEYIFWAFLFALGCYSGALVCSYVDDYLLNTEPKKIAFAGVFAILLAPCWALYSDLKKLKEKDCLSNREGRELNFLVLNAERRVIFIVLFFIFTVVYLLLMPVWVEFEEIVSYLYGFLFGLLFVSLGLLFSIFRYMREVSRFESKLSQRKREIENAKKQLEKIKKKE